ncbi:Cobalamin biosynthesis protein CobD [Candidatus Propionivibrio aalborgensis]|jgi:adenosylcobinamide-phosphate synthase|uniref:Cobalamin biosynthesis protein CobD n=1 Tax=Candidatus Propionivibrio aalborgensis TaxID=1860101 RepID=A0A1A8Y1G2_9RHOO|nr:CobD/CbiB family protein [Candidatus Propionivibrio aalborgensis]MBK7327255.1 CobD/CbiB family protein [Propionivibrio sp.]MBK7563192.1 CobD/CbiB family protein [Propionivibrio sp.]SBT10857.1 Cobalamin biosynthesis protein CobD [Candidatus Propionivibrio aalborgensis]
MNLFSLVAVLLLEQIRPLPYRSVVHEPLARFARFLEGYFNAGERSYGLIAWVISVGGLVLVAGGVYAALNALNPLLAWLWNVLVLYLTMGFRQFSHYYTDIQLALRMEDVPHARQLLSEWRGRPADDLSSSTIARLAIEEALSASHRHVFGVLVCFFLLPGPCGAVLYRAAAVFADTWGRRNDDAAERFGKFSQQAFAVIDWLPLRITAAGFAIVGNFEDAVYCWRNQADKWPDDQLGSGIGIVLASGAGALGVRLGMPVVEAGEISDRAEIGTGDEADVDFMQSAVGLVWRALMLWLLLLLLLGFASMVGP